MTDHVEMTAQEEDAAIDAAEAISLRDGLKREHIENVTRRPGNIALELWGAEIEAEILAELRRRP